LLIVLVAAFDTLDLVRTLRTGRANTRMNGTATRRVGDAATELTRGDPISLVDPNARVFSLITPLAKISCIGVHYVSIQPR